MYEQLSHSLLNDILNKIEPKIAKQDLRYFYTRLGANFYAIHSLFEKLYGGREDFEEQAQQLVETVGRPLDRRDRDHARRLGCSTGRGRRARERAATTAQRGRCCSGSNSRRSTFRLRDGLAVGRRRKHGDHHP